MAQWIAHGCIDTLIFKDFNTNAFKHKHMYGNRGWEGK